VRRIDLPPTTGIQRIAWNLRADPPGATQGQGADAARGGGRGGQGGQGGGRGGRGGQQQGPVVEPGRYRATLGTMAGDIVTPIGQPQAFMVVPLPQ